MLHAVMRAAERHASIHIACASDLHAAGMIEAIERLSKARGLLVHRQSRISLVLAGRCTITACVVNELHGETGLPTAFPQLQTKWFVDHFTVWDRYSGIIKQFAKWEAGQWEDGQSE